jgi:hypothetical protein
MHPNTHAQATASVEVFEQSTSLTSKDGFYNSIALIDKIINGTWNLAPNLAHSRQWLGACTISLEK